jgi:GNAT superfamily N-acetyltransferase
MAAALRGLDRVSVEPLDRLTLSHRAAQFVEPEDPEDPRIGQALRIYDAVIGATDQKVPVAQFLASVQTWIAAGRPSGEDWSYHFAIVLSDAQPRNVIGMLSAFGLGEFAFVGYVALAQEASGHGLGKDLVRWAERRIVEALRQRGGVYRGVFSEVERGRNGVPTPQFRFVGSIGFQQVPIDYRQPSLDPETETGGTPLALVFRPPGTGRGRMPTRRALRGFLERLGRVVFEMGVREARRFARSLVDSPPDLRYARSSD